MVAIKPKRFSEVYKNDFAMLADALGEISGSRLFHCGKCDYTIHTEKGEQKPKFCSKCGTEIDWVDFFTKIVKVCPTCNREYQETNIFCKLDGSRLMEKPVSEE